MQPVIVESKAGAVDEVSGRARNHDLVGVRSRHDPRRGMDRKAADVALAQLDLSGVEAGADADPESANDVANRGGGTNAALCAVEQPDHAVAGRLDELPAVLADDLVGQLVVPAY